MPPTLERIKAEARHNAEALFLKLEREGKLAEWVKENSERSEDKFMEVCEVNGKV